MQIPADLDSVSDDLLRLRRGFTDLVRTILEITRTESTDTKNTLYAQADQCLQDLSGTFENVGRTGRQAVEALAQRLGKRPLASLGAAFVIGLVIGRMSGDSD